jgi:ACT domain-containing protein
MSRRFLTVEDVRRLGGPEITVDETTIVTPQALDAAGAAGITIRTQHGAYQEPRPDRGPDAELARRSLPHLPEPEDNPSLASSAIVTAVGRNRGGVLAELTSAIAAQGGNVHDVSQKVVEGYFHIILTVELTSEGTFDSLKTCLECLGNPDDFAVRVMNERVFRYMHRV